MKLVSFSFNNSLYFILYVLSSFSQLKMIELLEMYPKMIIMFITSISLCYIVILENISLLLNVDIFKQNRDSINLQTGLFNKRKIKLIQAKKREEEQFIYYALSMSILSVLTAINNSLFYLLFLSLFTGCSGLICIFNNVLTWLFLFFWIKKKIYRHYVLAFVILICALIISVIIDSEIFSQFYSFFGSYFLSIGFFILTSLATSSREVLEKYVLDVLYMAHSKLLFIEGVGGLIVTLIVFGIIQLIQCELSEKELLLSPKLFCSSSKASNIGSNVINMFSFINYDTLYVWIYFIATFIYELFRIMINKKHGPTHRYSADLFAFTLYMIIDIITTYINEGNQFFDWTMLIVILAQILGCLIYNENIRLHCFNLAYNTRFSIEMRAAFDKKIIEDALVDIEELADFD